jgi:hypothetical protein
VRHKRLFVEAWKRRLVPARDPQKPIRQHALSICQMANHFLDAPFAVCVPMPRLFRRHAADFVNDRLLPLEHRKPVRFIRRRRNVALMEFRVFVTRRSRDLSRHAPIVRERQAKSTWLIRSSAAMP